MGKAVIVMSRLVKIVDNKYVQIEECRNPNLCFNTSEYDDFEDYCTLRETFDPFEMFYENQELKKKYENAVADYETTMFEKEQLNSLVNSCQEKIRQLKKQLENCYCNRTDCSGRIKDSKVYDSLVQKVETQQKEFINFLEDNWKQTQDIWYIKILQKYKNIIGE